VETINVVIERDFYAKHGQHLKISLYQKQYAREKNGTYQCDMEK
jgi:hypothetical protein